MQVAVPLHAPLQPVKADPAGGVAVSVSTVPGVKLPEQLPGQAIPEPETVAPDGPASDTDTVVP